MSARTKVAITVCVTIALFLISAAWAVTAAGGGHGSYVPMLVLFPFCSIVMALLAMAGDSSEGVTMVAATALALIQFALYGFLIGRAWLNGRVKRMLLILGAAHGAVLLAFAGFYFFDSR